MSHLPYPLSLQELINKFREATVIRGESTLLYDNPDATTMGDAELIEYYNKSLEKDKDFELPKVLTFYY